MKLLNNFKKIIPKNLKSAIKKCIFVKKYGFSPPKEGYDLSGYEILLDVILQEKIYQLEGDFVEIGVFLGGGTYKLSKLLEKVAPYKKLYAVDIFNPEIDKSVCTKGISMSEMYQKILKGRSQYEIYKEVTKNCKNIITIIGDSKKITLECPKICFAYIDGNHSPEYVENDFYLVWNKLVPGGIIAFDDYGYDLPQVTDTIHELIAKHIKEILKIKTVGLKTILIFRK